MKKDELVQIVAKLDEGKAYSISYESANTVFMIDGTTHWQERLFEFCMENHVRCVYTADLAH